MSIVDIYVAIMKKGIKLHLERVIVLNEGDRLELKVFEFPKKNSF